jgi:hypothetical protein
MFDGDGSETLELQAYQIAKNATLNYKDEKGTTLYRGSAPCPGCNIIMDPVQALSSYKGLCLNCAARRKGERLKGKWS